MRTLLPYGSAVPYPVLYSVTASGPYRRPAARRRSASAAPPLRGLGSSQNKFVNAAKNAAQTSSGPRQESTPWHLGAGPTRSASPSVTRAGYGKFNETEITTMYSNKVTLIGFTGADAEVRTNNDRSLTTLSLATK